MDTLNIEEFNFELHKRNAVESYRNVRDKYDKFSQNIKLILENCLKSSKIKYHSIEARAKELDKFGEKSVKPLPEDSNKPKYTDPLREITDLAGIRIITFFPKTIDEVDNVLKNEFDIIEKSDKNDLLENEDRLGYQSIHYLIKLKANRNNLPEYSIYNGLIAEIQVRTILQHAWAEIEHDIEYKSTATIPRGIKRRLMALAGLLEIGDREFQNIQDDNVKIKDQSRSSIKKGNFNEVEITGDSLKTYLDKKYGSDGRLKEFSYEFMAKTLIDLGFKDLKQVDDCVKEYDDDQISRYIYGGRSGQINRFEAVLIASIGEDIIKYHPYCIGAIYNNMFWIQWITKNINLLKNNGIITGKYKLNINKSNNISE